MIRRPKYEFPDVFPLPAIALSAKRITLMTFAVIGAWLLYSVFAYASLLMAGDDLRTILHTWGAFPFVIPSGFGAQSIWFIGLAGAIVCLMTGFTGVAGFCMEEARGNRFMTLTQGMHFGFARLKQIALAELAIVSFIAFVLLLIIIIGVIARVPFVGQSIFAMFALFPGFVIALFLVFIMTVGCISIFLLPAVTAADRRHEAFMSILESFSTLIRQPLRWIGATALSAVFAKLAVWIFFAASLAAMRLLVWGGSVFGGDAVQSTYQMALGKFPIYTWGGEFLLTIWPGMRSIHLLSLIPRQSSDSDVGSFVMAAVLFVILALVISYGLCIVIAGQTRAYILIKFLKDEHRLGDEPSVFAESAAQVNENKK